jgi:hypothetical protein
MGQGIKISAITAIRAITLREFSENFNTFVLTISCFPYVPPFLYHPQYDTKICMKEQAIPVPALRHDSIVFFLIFR